MTYVLDIELPDDVCASPCTCFILSGSPVFGDLFSVKILIKIELNAASRFPDVQHKSVNKQPTSYLDCTKRLAVLYCLFDPYSNLRGDLTNLHFSVLRILCLRPDDLVCYFSFLVFLELL